MQIYNILGLVRQAHDSLGGHRCSARAFEIAYWQEHQKLNEALKVNKDLALELEETRSKANHYERVLIPNYIRAEEDAEEYAQSLRSKLEALQQGERMEASGSSLSSSANHCGATGEARTQVERVAGDDGSTPLAVSVKRDRSSEEIMDNLLEDKQRAKGNRLKLRRMAKANLLIST
jgi:hypothetical protein